MDGQQRVAGAHPDRVPFSRSGAWTCLGALPGYQPLGPGLYWRSNHHRNYLRRELFRFTLWRDGQEVPAVVDFFPHVLVLRPEDGSAGQVEILFEHADSLRLRGEELTLRVEARRLPQEDRNAYVLVVQPVGEDRWSVNLRTALRRYLWEKLAGVLVARSDWDGTRSSFVEMEFSPGPDGVWEAAADEYWSTWERPQRAPFVQARAAVAEDFARFCAPFDPPTEGLEQTRQLALYTLWMNTVAASGHLRRPALLMSRNWMDQVWSWDNMFNAAALAKAHPQLAEDQWRVIFDLQDAHGALPDAVSDLWLHYNFSKPPVQGLLYLWTAQTAPEFWTAERRAWFYRHTAAFTDWWLRHRRFPGRRLCHYLHGNDSGWDNTTLLREGAPIEMPDLNAFLVVQLRLLARLAREDHGDSEAAARWSQEADALLAALLDGLWDGTQFVGRLPLDNGRVVSARSLVTLIPLVLGGELPAEFLPPRGFARAAAALHGLVYHVHASCRRINAARHCLFAHQPAAANGFAAGLSFAFSWK